MGEVVLGDGGKLFLQRNDMRVRSMEIALLIAPLIAAVSWSTYSYAVSDQEMVFFARSGSVLVAVALLCGIVHERLENRYWMVMMPILTATDPSVREAHNPLFAKVSRTVQFAIFIATALGTLIWGYGDYLAIEYLV